MWLFVCHMVGGSSVGEVGERVIIWSFGIKVGVAIKSWASTPGWNMPPLLQSSTGSQEDPGQTTSREEINAHEPADSAGKHRFPFEMWEWPSALSSVISFINNKIEITGLNSTMHKTCMEKIN